MKRPRLTFKVSLILPYGCSPNTLKSYITEAVQTWRGCYHPDHPIFSLDGYTVKVTHLRDSKPKAGKQPP